MRVLHIAVALLIAGITIPTVTNALSWTMTLAVGYLENHGISRQQVIEVEERVKTICTQTSGLAAFYDVQENLDAFLYCAVPALTESMTKMTDANSNGKWKPFVNDLCPKLPVVGECGTSLLDSTKTCLDPDKQKHFDLLRNMVILTHEFGCHDGGDKISHFIETGGIDCVSSRSEGLKLCLPKETVDVASVTTNLDSGLSSLNLNRTECSIIQNFRSCAVTEMKHCDKPGPADAFDSLIDSFMSLTSCQNVLLQPDQGNSPCLEKKCEKNGGPTAYDTYHESKQLASNVSDLFGSVLRRKCEKNGGPTAYDTYQESKQLASNVSDLLADGKDLLVEMWGTQTEGELDALAKKYCRRILIKIEVNSHVVDSIKSCLNPEEKRSIDMVYKLHCSVLKYICQDGGSRLTKLVASRGDPAQYVPLEKCFYENILSIVDFSAEGWEKTETLPSTHDKFLTKLDNFRKCSVQALSQCENKLAATQYVNSMITEISIEIRNDDSPKVQTSPNSGSTITPEVNECPKRLNDCSECCSIEALAQCSADNNSTVQVENVVDQNVMLETPSSNIPKGDLAKVPTSQNLDISDSTTITSIVSECPKILEDFSECCSAEALAQCNADNELTEVVKVVDLNKLLVDDLTGIPTSSNPGIPSYTIATEVNEAPKKLPSKVPVLLIITGVYDADSLSVTNQEVEEYIRFKCETNGGPTAYYAVQRIPEYLKNWYEEVRQDLLALNTLFGSTHQKMDPTATRNRISVEYCAKGPIIESRLKYLANSVKPCLNRQDREKVDVVHESIISALRYGCQDKAYRVGKFLHHDGRECLTSKTQSLWNCLNNIVPDSYDQSSNVFRVTSTEIMSVLSANKCAKGKELQHCIIGALKGCKNRQPLGLLDALMARITGLVCATWTEESCPLPGSRSSLDTITQQTISSYSPVGIKKLSWA